jgi:hypothetical protein
MVLKSQGPFLLKTDTGLAALGLGALADNYGWRYVTALFVQLGVVFLTFAVLMPLIIWSTKRRDRCYRTPSLPTVSNVVRTASPTTRKPIVVETGDHDQVVEAFARVLDGRVCLFSADSDLPFPRSQIRVALDKAWVDPAYEIGKPAIRVARLTLDTFVPAEHLAAVERLYQEVLAASDEKRADTILAEAPEMHRHAVVAVLTVAGESLPPTSTH